MSDLTKFLLARIAEDEFAWGVVAKRDTTALLYGKPIAPRMLAMCAAHRRIVELHPLEDYAGKPSCWLCAPEFSWGREPTGDEQPCATLRALATVYADHVDYRKEWKP